MLTANSDKKDPTGKAKGRKIWASAYASAAGSSVKVGDLSQPMKSRVIVEAEEGSSAQVLDMKEPITGFPPWSGVAGHGNV